VRGRFALLALSTALMAALAVGTALGSAGIGPRGVLAVLIDRLTPLPPPWQVERWQETVVMDLRLPRVVGGALVGAALALAGALFQSLLRNPLADPYVIGTSAGAALGATISLIFPLRLSLWGFGAISMAAFAGALLAVLLVYNLARISGEASVVSLLLAGLAVSSILAAAMVLLLVTVGELQVRLPQLFTFLMGGITVNRWAQLALVAGLLALGLMAALALSPYLNAFALGEEGAAAVGVEVERTKAMVLALGSLLTAAAVTVGGLIGFVGLMVPHAVRLVLGADARLLLPCAALAGASFLVLADLGARTLLAPGEIPVGVITGLVGGPFFLYLLRRYQRGYAL
jgi:iron complex transport system permease protein